MPRTARVALAHMPHPPVQRRHNRQVVFAGDKDYARYLEDRVGQMVYNERPHGPLEGAP